MQKIGIQSRRMNTNALRRMRQSVLETQLELRQIEYDELSQVIDSILTVTERRDRAIERRDELDGQVARIRADLDALSEMAAPLHTHAVRSGRRF
jgi:hypothetical protein